MAKEQGWWTFETTVEPSETDLEHIARQIRDGFTSGQICKDDFEPAEAPREYRCPECDTYSGTFTPQGTDELLHSICGRVGSVASFIRGTEEYEAVYGHQEG